jgi:hypothetical protein
MARRDAPATRFRSNGARARPAARDTSPPLICSLVVFVRGHIRVDVAEGEPDREDLTDTASDFLFILSLCIQ